MTDEEQGDRALQCVSCRRIVPKAEYCIYCGQPLRGATEVRPRKVVRESDVPRSPFPGVVICPHCRSLVNPSTRYCPSCGEKLLIT